MDNVRSRKIRLNIALALMDFSQAELANRAGLATQTISRLMKGRVSPDNSTLALIAHALGQRKSWLEGEGDIKDFTVPKEILDITVDQDIVAMRLKHVAEHAEEDPPAYAPVGKRTKRVNRRGELAIYPIADRPGRGVASIPRWENVAAGFGEDLEKSEEITYVRELPYWRGVHAVTVRGDSMEDTLFPGDLILVQPFPGEPIELPPRGQDPKNSKRQLMRFVPEDELFILSVNNDPPTVKRVQYQGEVDWKLQIVPDNGQEYRTYTVSAHDKVVFYAKVMGIGDKRKGKLKYGARAKTVP